MTSNPELKLLVRLITKPTIMGAVLPTAFAMPLIVPAPAANADCGITFRIRT